MSRAGQRYYVRRAQVSGSFGGAQQQALVLALVIRHRLPISSHAASPSPAITSSPTAATALSWLFPVSVHSAGFSVWACVHTRVSYWLVLELGFWLLMFSQINAKSFYSMCARSLLPS